VANARPGIIPARDIPPGPRGLGGYCWAPHPESGLRCCQPLDHEKQGASHLHPYVTPSVYWK
jgi:hypothetical protein